MWSTEFDEPKADKVNHLTWESDYNTSKEMWEITTRRAMDTGDEQDAIFELDKDIIMSYALRKDGAEFEKHENVGHFTLQFKADG